MNFIKCDSFFFVCLFTHMTLRKTKSTFCLIQALIIYFKNILNKTSQYTSGIVLSEGML